MPTPRWLVLPSLSHSRARAHGASWRLINPRSLHPAMASAPAAPRSPPPPLPPTPPRAEPDRASTSEDEDQAPELTPQPRRRRDVSPTRRPVLQRQAATPLAHRPGPNTGRGGREEAHQPEQAGEIARGNVASRGQATSRLFAFETDPDWLAVREQNSRRAELVRSRARQAAVRASRRE